MDFARTIQKVSFEVLVYLKEKNGRSHHPFVVGVVTTKKQELKVEVVVQLVVEAVAADETFVQQENRWEFVLLDSLEFFFVLLMLLERIISRVLVTLLKRLPLASVIKISFSAHPDPIIWRAQHL
jgi:hypothetical protein